MSEITQAEIETLRQQLAPLINVQFELLRIPRVILRGFEPSQIGTMIGSLMDACIPQLSQILPDDAKLRDVGLKKHAGILGDREGYPDYLHSSGKRLELKLLYVDPVDVGMKRPPTRREASARITQKVTIRNVDAANDVLLVIPYQLCPHKDEPNLFSPTIIDLGLFSMIECVRARDHRLLQGGGRWFGDYQTPTILSKAGKLRRLQELDLISSVYGRKESEGHHYNEDTNFGKLKRVPLEALHRFLQKHGANYTKKGSYPAPWIIGDLQTSLFEESDADSDDN